MTFKIISGSYEDDPMLQQLIFEGVNEMVQSAHLPSDDLVMPVASDDIIIYAVDPKEDDIIGVLCYHIHLGVAEITLLYVEPSSRQQGVARAMMSKLNTNMVAAGAFRKATSIRVTNAVATTVLSKFGFQFEVIRMEAATVLPG